MNPTPPVRVAEVAVSAPALAHQWARQGSAPHGAAMAAHREIAGRGRGGVAWAEPSAVAVSIVVRPDWLASFEAEVGWLAAGLAAADAIEELGVGGRGRARVEPRLWWPDQICWPADGERSDAMVTVSLLAESILEPGRVAYAVLTVRFSSSRLGDRSEREQAAEVLVAALRRWGDRLDRPGEVASAYRSRCSTIGRVVAVGLSPHGSTRGTVADITGEGALVLRSSTGLTETFPVAATRTVEPLD